MKELTLFLALVTAISCHTKQNDQIAADRPSDVLHPDTMGQILIDIHFAEAAIKRKQLKGDTAIFTAQKYYNEIYSIHQVTEEKFRKSMEFYRNHPKIFEKIYKDILEKISQKEGQLSGEGQKKE